MTSTHARSPGKQACDGLSISPGLAGEGAGGVDVFDGLPDINRAEPLAAALYGDLCRPQVSHSHGWPNSHLAARTVADY